MYTGTIRHDSVVTGRLRVLAAALTAAAIGLGVTGCSTSSHHDSVSTQQSAVRTSSAAGAPAGAAGSCALTSLPAEAMTTVRLIHSGGPFPHPRNDGVVFRNRERQLPAESSGYYHEYTVDTPGASTRGARRVITGGTPLTSPPVYYYTGDHYKSFCTITGAG